MSKGDFPLVNFRFSPSALSKIEEMREEWNQMFPERAAALCVAWGETTYNDGRYAEGVFISFYTERQMPEISFGIQHVQGVDLIFFVLPDGQRRFAGKTVDFEPGRGFFLS